jgi:hypothetical protein
MAQRNRSIGQLSGALEDRSEIVMDCAVDLEQVAHLLPGKLGAHAKVVYENNDGFAIAERRYTRRDDGRPVKDKVYVALHLERGGDSGQWVLDEIKSIR